MFPGKGPALLPRRHAERLERRAAHRGGRCREGGGRTALCHDEWQGRGRVLREDVTGRLGGGFLWIFEGNGWDFLINYS